MSYDLGAYQEAMRAGHAFAWDLKWEAASRQYRLALNERPGDPAATLSLARALERMGDLDAALEMYEEAQRLLPDHAPVLVSLVELQQRLGDLASAATSYCRLAALYLDQGQAARALEIVRRLGEYPLPEREALGRLTAAAERVGEAEVRAIAERLLAALPEPSAADEAALADQSVASGPAASPGSPPERPLELPPDVPEPVQDLMIALAASEQVGRPKAGLSEVVGDWCPLPTELLRLSPAVRAELALAFHETAQSLASAQLNAALDAGWRALGIASDYLPTHVLLARVDAAAGDRSAAERRLTTVAELYASQQQYRQAAETWEQLAVLLGGSEAVEARIVDLLSRQGATSDALNLLRSAAARCLIEDRVDDAIERLDRALELKPDAFALGLWRARLLAERGRDADATAWIDQALAAATDSAARLRLSVARATLAADAQRWSELEALVASWQSASSDDWLTALTEAANWGVLQGGNPARWYLAGQILAAVGDARAAEGCYRAALALPDTRPATLRLALGRLAIARSDWQSAADWLVSCLDGLSSPSEFGQSDELLISLLDVAIRLEALPLRVRALRELIRLHPDRPALPVDLAEALGQSGDLAGARAQLRALATHFDQIGEPARSLAVARAVAAINPPDPPSQLELARRCLDHGLRREAIAACERVVDLVLGSRPNDGLLAERAAGGDVLATGFGVLPPAEVGLEVETTWADLAAEALRTLIDLTRQEGPARVTRYRELLARVCPGDHANRLALAMMYLSSGRPHRALAEMRRLAAALAETGDWTGAAQAFRTALLLDPWDPRLAADAAEAFARAGDRDSANALARRARQLGVYAPVIRGLGAELQGRSSAP